MRRNGVEVELKFSKEALEKLKRTVMYKPITLQFGTTTVGKVVRSWIEDNGVFVEFEGETFNKKYLVPSIKAASTVGGVMKTVICTELGLTDNPADKTLLTLDINKLFFIRDGFLYFWDETQNEVGPYGSFYDVNRAMLEYIKLLLVVIYGNFRRIGKSWIRV